MHVVVCIHKPYWRRQQGKNDNGLTSQGGLTWANKATIQRGNPTPTKMGFGPNFAVFSDNYASHGLDSFLYNMGPIYLTDSKSGPLMLFGPNLYCFF